MKGENIGSKERDAQLKDFVEDVITIVHGSQLNKAQLAKELYEKLPRLKRKSQVQHFLSTYCNRTRNTTQDDSQVRVESFSRQRQMVDTDKLIEDKLITPNEETEEKPDELKVRLSRKLQDILENRIQSEIDNTNEEQKGE